MFNFDQQLATDKITAQKIIYLLILTFSLFILAFYTVNVEKVWNQSFFYWVLLTTGLIIWLISKVIFKQKGFDFPNPITWEETTAFGKLSLTAQLALLSLFFLVGMAVFVKIGESPVYQILSTPTFQLIELTPELSAVLSGISGMVEDFVFFGIVSPLIYGIVYYMTRSPYVSLAVALFITPTIFTLFHIGHYGLERQITMEKVWLFGFASTVIVLVLRNVLLVDFIHILNNAAVTYFSVVKVSNPIGYFITSFFIIAIFWVYYLFRRKGVRNV